MVLRIVERENESITVRMPPNGAVTPPGYYMLFILNSAGTPSVGRFIEFRQLTLCRGLLGATAHPLTTTDIPDIPVGSDITTMPTPVWDLGTLELGQTRRALLRCKNVGTGELRIMGPEFSGYFRTADTPGAPLSGIRPLPKNLDVRIWGSPAQPGDFTELEVNFTPTEMSAHTGSLWLNTNALDLGAFSFILRANVIGFGVEVVAAVPPEPEVQFGEVAVGTTAFRDVTVRNRGTIVAVVSDLTIESDGQPSNFAPSLVVPERLVPPSGSRNFSVAFSPQAVGQEHAIRKCSPKARRRPPGSRNGLR